MLTSSPIPKQTVGRTFFYSIIVLGVAALFQIGAFGWAFIQSFHSNAVNDSRMASTSTPAPVAEPQKTFATTTPAPIIASLVTPGITEPTPIPNVDNKTVLTPAQIRLSELINQARALSDRGDISTALIRLREALALAPDDPRVLAELGGAYDKIGSADKALEYWQHIVNIGKSAGSYYEMALARLNPPDEGTPKYDTDGILPGCVLAVAGITKADSQENPGKRFTLNVPVKARPGAAIDVHDVSIYVIFYELLDDGSIAQTNASVTNKWITSPVDWSQNNIQILQVGYTAASLDPKATLSETRIYFGYIARVYYEGKLQDVRSEPAKLLNQFPPPHNLSKEDQQ